jgi:hypothetical protein
MSLRRLTLLALAIVLSGFAAWRCCAQYVIEPDPAPNSWHRVRVVNDMGRSICVKIIPYGRNNYFHADLAPGQSHTDDLWDGQRAMCVWDDRTGQLLIAACVIVNRNGVLHVRPMFAAAAPGAAKAAEEPGRAAQPAAAPRMPSMQIEGD